MPLGPRAEPGLREWGSVPRFGAFCPLTGQVSWLLQFAHGTAWHDMGMDMDMLVAEWPFLRAWSGSLCNPKTWKCMAGELTQGH